MLIDYDEITMSGMATLKKTDSGKWQAQVARSGRRVAKSFRTKREAQDWAAREEYLIETGGQNAKGMAFRDVLDRYAREVSPAKKGARWEIIRLEKIGRDPIGGVSIGDLTAQHFATWRDRRLLDVSPASVRREMVLLSGVLTVARKEWGLIHANPMADVRKPANSRPRSRRVTDDEIARLTAAARRDKSKRTILAFRFAVETGMRAGEICGLTPDSIDGRVARLAETKNGDPRAVPLSSAALAILDEVGGDFRLSSRDLDSHFRLCRGRAGITGLTFHDSRAEALTRLSAKVDVLTLARISGHRNISELMTYYRESAEDIAGRLG